MNDRPRFWFVELKSTVSQRDDEIWKIRATSKSAATIIALSSIRDRWFRVGKVVPAHGGTKKDQALAYLFKQYCTKTLG